MNPVARFVGHPFFHRLSFCVVLLVSCPAHLVAAKANKSEVRDANGEMNADGTRIKPRKRDGKPGATVDDAGSGVAESPARARLREQFEVADDAEWAVIAERMNKVEELRRSLWSAGTRPRGGVPLGDKPKRGANAGVAVHPEEDSLRAAVADKLPDAEVKARLARVHGANEQTQARLIAAQAELRAVLTVRQEALAVLAGLLPP